MSGKGNATFMNRTVFVGQRSKWTFRLRVHILSPACGFGILIKSLAVFVCTWVCAESQCFLSSVWTVWCVCCWHTGFLSVESFHKKLKNKQKFIFLFCCWWRITHWTSVHLISSTEFQMSERHQRRVRQVDVRLHYTGVFSPSVGFTWDAVEDLTAFKELQACFFSAAECRLCQKIRTISSVWKKFHDINILLKLDLYVAASSHYINHSSPPSSIKWPWVVIWLITVFIMKFWIFFANSFTKENLKLKAI